METTNLDLQPVISILNELKSRIEAIKPPKRYYRNKNLKELFGLSDNTIISYRDLNILPFTKLGEIYYYPVDEIDTILLKNSNFDLLSNKIKE